MSRKRKPGAGLFNGHWTDLEGRKLERIRREEYAELYRLHRICAEYEKLDAAGAAAVLDGKRPTCAATRAAPPLPERLWQPPAAPWELEANPFHD